MTCRAKIVKKTKVEPLNGIHAIAYAAMQAMTRGKIAAGIAMANELKKYGAMPFGITEPPLMTWL